MKGDNIELSTRFGPLDLREGGTITYAWPEDKTRDFWIQGVQASLDVHGENGAPFYKALWWFRDNGLFRLRRMRSTKPLLACPLLSLPHRRYGYYMLATPYACGIEQMQSEIEIVGEVPADVHPHAMVDLALFGRRA